MATLHGNMTEAQLTDAISAKGFKKVIVTVDYQTKSVTVEAIPIDPKLMNKKITGNSTKDALVEMLDQLYIMQLLNLTDKLLGKPKRT
jgi:hypothetical protein